MCSRKISPKSGLFNISTILNLKRILLKEFFVSVNPLHLPGNINLRNNNKNELSSRR